MGIREIEIEAENRLAFLRSKMKDLKDDSEAGMRNSSDLILLSNIFEATPGAEKSEIIDFKIENRKLIGLAPTVRHCNIIYVDLVWNMLITTVANQANSSSNGEGKEKVVHRPVTLIISRNAFAETFEDYMMRSANYKHVSNYEGGENAGLRIVIAETQKTTEQNDPKKREIKNYYLFSNCQISLYVPSPENTHYIGLSFVYGKVEYGKYDDDGKAILFGSTPASGA